MNYIEYALIVILAGTGGICTYMDCRKGIIPNKLLLVGILSGVPFHLLLLLRYNCATYYGAWLLNMVIADTLAFLIYYNKFWTAGDAKLFMTLYFLIPPPILDIHSLTHCVNPYIYIFIIAFVWLLFDSLFRIVSMETRTIKSNHPKRALLNYCIVIIESLTIYYVAFNLFNHFVNNNSLFVSMLLIIYAYFCGKNDHMKKWYIVGLHAVVLAITMIICDWMVAIPKWEHYIVVGIILIIQQYASEYNYKLVPTAEVKAGMIPAMEMIFLFKKSRIRNLPVNISEDLSAQISEEEANAIRRWGNSPNGKPQILIVRKIPFAIMIVTGFIAWISVRLAR